MTEYIKRFEIIDKLGEGSLSIVYHAFDPSIKRHVALKVLKLEHFSDPEERERYVQLFYREARVAGNLTHPNIAILFDVDQTDEGVPFLTLEYVEGITLAELIRQGPPCPYVDALKIVHKTAAALHHAHQSGIIHRDFKPSNIMITVNHEPKILDFGFAQWQAQFTTDHSLKGTPLYMAPEQIRQEELSPATDLFAFGIILWQLVIGDHPFMADTLDAILERILQDKPGPAPEHLIMQAGLNPADWCAFFDRALNKDPEQRYPNAMGMARFFERMMTPAASIEGLKLPIRLSLPMEAQTIIHLQPEAEVASPSPTPVLAPESHDLNTIPPISWSKPSQVQNISFIMTILSVGAIVLGVLLGGFLAWWNGQHPPITPTTPDAQEWAFYTPKPEKIIKSSHKTQSSTSRIVVEATPPAELSWDSQSLGITPVTLEAVHPGLHQITLAASGYHSLKTWVYLPPGTSELPIRLYLIKEDNSVTTGTLLIQSNPPGASLTFDGRESGTTPIELNDIRPGNHRVILSLTDYLTIERTVYIDKGHFHNLVIELEPAAKDLETSRSTSPEP